MIRFFKVAFILALSVYVVSCSKDSATETPIIPFQYQYPSDIKDIEEYLNTYYIKSISPDLDVVFEKIEEGNPFGRVSIMNQTDHPLEEKIVRKHSLDYKVYFLNLREAANYGIDKNPTRVDSVLVSYKGSYVYNKTEKVEVLPATVPPTYTNVKYIADKVFQEAQNPIWVTLDNVITGWEEIFPLFKSGTFVNNGSGSITYSDFGAGVIFIPSGLGYYNVAQNSIPTYSPLIFSFKLKNVRYRDHDSDGILSKDEDLNGDGKFNNDNTDFDALQNYLDIDDDGDGFTTKSETKYKVIDISTDPDTEYTFYYPYAGAAVDDPATPFVDERKGIPDCSGDHILLTRLRKHLDKGCH